MASIAASSQQYDLEFGDVIYVDTGNYALPTNIAIGSRGLRRPVQGPDQCGSRALLNRQNVTTTSYGFALTDADAVTLANLSVTDALLRRSTSTGASTGLPLKNSTLFENAYVGLYIADAPRPDAVVTDNVFYGYAPDDNHDQNYGALHPRPAPTVLRNEAYHINGSDQYGIYLENTGVGTVVRNNKLHDNSYYRPDRSSPTGFEASGNLAWDNDTGFFFQDSTSTTRPGRTTTSPGATPPASTYHEQQLRRGLQLDRP